MHDGSENSHLLGLDIFVGGKKDGKTVQDYHSMFNHAYFVDWFKKLLDEVEDCGWRSVVFVMDNAKYHKGKPDDTPKGNWKKAKMYDACVAYELDGVQPTDLKTTMWARLKAHIAEHIQPVVVTMARERGHDVVYTAPNYSELQPIEMIWANVKGVVGRAYTTTTTFQDVYDRLVNAFRDLDCKTIHDTIEASTAKLFALDKALRESEEAATTNGPDDSASSDDDGDSSTLGDDLD